MKSPINTKILIISIISGLILTLTGCATKGPPKPHPMDGHTLQIFLSKGKDPLLLGVQLDDNSNRNICRIHASKNAFMHFSSSRKSALPVIKVSARVAKKNGMLLDTSSRKSWVLFSLADNYALVPAGQSPPRYVAKHVNCDTPSFLCIAPDLEFNKMHMANALLYSYSDYKSLWPVSRDYTQGNIKLVMGYGMMKTFNFIKIDFKNRTVIFSASDTYSVNEDALITSTPIMWTEEGSLAIEATISGTKELFFIDTGGQFEIAGSSPKSKTLHHFNIGELVFRNVKISPAKKFLIEQRTHPSIGTELLKDLVMVIDVDRQMIHFEIPPGK